MIAMIIRFVSVLVILLGFFLGQGIVRSTELRCVLAQSSSSSPSQAKPKSTRSSGSITGVVLTSDGRPAGEVTVRLGKVSGNGSDQASTETGDNGVFRFDNVASGVYRAWAWAEGLTEPQSKICRPGDSLEFRVWKGRGGVITGRVTDANGEAAVEAPVRAIMIRDAEGKLLTGTRALRGHRSRLTDDRGVYRFWGLQPGSYLVAAGGRNNYTHEPGPYDDQPLTYHPESPSSGAREVVVQEGGERAGVDIILRSDSVYSITGVVSGSLDGIQHEGVAVVLTQAATGMMLPAQITDPRQSREFRFDALSEGEYDLQAVAAKGSSVAAASSAVRVTIKSSDVRGLDLKLKPLGSISIRVALEPGRVQESKSCENPEALRLAETLVMVHEDGGSQANLSRGPLFQFLSGLNQGITAVPQTDGHCRFPSINAGRYRLEVDPSNDHYYVDSITQAASNTSAKRTDIAREGLKVSEGEHVAGVAVKLAPGAAMLVGRVMLQRDAVISASTLSVFLVPAERESADDVLRFAETRVSAAGEFAFRHVKPGRYYLVARPASEQQGSINPVWWETAGRAQLREEAEKGGGQFPSFNPRENRVELAPCARARHLLPYGQ